MNFQINPAANTTLPPVPKVVAVISSISSPARLQMPGYVVQNISLRRDKFTKGEAMDWIRKHGYRPIKDVHVSPHFYMYRIVDPERLRGARFRSVDLGDVGRMILAYM
jgi:hypothetical protein